MTDNNAYDVPHISAQLAEHLKAELSADSQIAQGLLSDPAVTRSESYLLGFLAGLGYGRQVINVMVANQDAYADESNTLTRTDVDVTDSWLTQI